MALIKTAILNSIAVATRLATGLLLNKVLALAIGPAGFGMLGQLQSLITLLTTTASGAVSAGVTRWTAEYASDGKRNECRALWGAASLLVLFASTISTISLLAFKKYIATDVLGDSRQEWIVSLVALIACPVGLHALLLAIINGRKAIGSYIFISIGGSLGALAVVSAGVYGWGKEGALLALLLNQLILCALSVVVCTKVRLFRWAELVPTFEKRNIGRLGHYIIITAVGALLPPLAQVIIRSSLIQNLGLDAAGQWSALTRVSDLAFGIVTSTLSLYYLPRIAEIKTSKDFNREILLLYKILLPCVGIAACIVYSARSQLVVLLFSESFSGVEPLFKWQLLGDFMKVGSWIFAYVMVGRAMVRVYIITELLFFASFVLGSLYLIPHFGLVAVPIVHASSYFAYWILVALIVRRAIRLTPDRA